MVGVDFIHNLSVVEDCPLVLIPLQETLFKCSDCSFHIYNLIWVFISLQALLQLGDSLFFIWRTKLFMSFILDIIKEGVKRKANAQ